MVVSIINVGCSYSILNNWLSGHSRRIHYRVPVRMGLPYIILRVAVDELPFMITCCIVFTIILEGGSQDNSPIELFVHI